MTEFVFRWVVDYRGETKTSIWNSISNWAALGWITGMYNFVLWISIVKYIIVTVQWQKSFLYQLSQLLLFIYLFTSIPLFSLFLFIYYIIHSFIQGTCKGLESQVESLSVKLKNTNSELDAKSNSARNLERKHVEVWFCYCFLGQT